MLTVPQWRATHCGAKQEGRRALEHNPEVSRLLDVLKSLQRGRPSSARGVAPEAVGQAPLDDGRQPESLPDASAAAPVSKRLRVAGPSSPPQAVVVALDDHDGGAGGGRPADTPADSAGTRASRRNQRPPPFTAQQRYACLALRHVVGSDRATVTLLRRHVPGCASFGTKNLRNWRAAVQVRLPHTAAVLVTVPFVRGTCARIVCLCIFCIA